MFGITDLPTYLIGVIAVILLPGPNSLFCLATAAKQGIKAGYQAMLGILVGDSILMLLTVFGAGTLLKLYPVLFNAIKIIGGLYLAYLGVNLIKAGVQKWQTRHITANKDDTQSNHLKNSTEKNNYFSKALALSLTNPKAILFFLSFFIPFVNPTYENPLLSFLILAIILQIVSFSYLNILIFSGSNLAQHFAKRIKLASASLMIVGLMFIGFAIKLWMASV